MKEATQDKMEAETNLWEGTGDVNAFAARVAAWRARADASGRLMVVGPPEWIQQLLRAGPAEGREVYAPDAGGTAAVRWTSDQAHARTAWQGEEHRALLLILPEALIAVAEQDTDRAARLAARAWVNLKTDPTGQRRFDGLLHRFTGVLHRGPRASASAARSAGLRDDELPDPMGL